MCGISGYEWYERLESSREHGDSVKELSAVLSAKDLEEIERDGFHTEWYFQTQKLEYVFSRAIWDQFSVPCFFLLVCEMEQNDPTAATDLVKIYGYCREYNIGLKGEATVKRGEKEDVTFRCTLRCKDDSFSQVATDRKTPSPESDSDREKSVENGETADDGNAENIVRPERYAFPTASVWHEDDLRFQMNKLSVEDGLKPATLPYPLLRNGCHTPAFGTSDTHPPMRYRAVNTCAFDTLMGILMQGATRSKNFMRLIESSDARIATYMVETLKTAVVNQDNYKQRFYILNDLSFLDRQITENNLLKVDGKCSIALLYEKLFETMPFSTTNTFCEACDDCSWRRSNQCYIDTGTLFHTGFGRMQQAFDSINFPFGADCKKCGEPVVELKEYGPYLVFDVSIYTYRQYTEMAFPGRKKNDCTLTTVTPLIEIGLRTYQIAGIADYDQAFDAAEGHYTAYLFDGTRWNLYDDLRETAFSAPSHTPVSPHLIVYVEKS